MNGPTVAGGYTEDHARSGLADPLPELECFSNQFPESDYVIEIETPEFDSVCPKTGLPDSGDIQIQYIPDRQCVELKSLKLYLLGYRNMGIFSENVVNRIFEDFKRAVAPRWLKVRGDFNARGGLHTRVEREYRAG